MVLAHRRCRVGGRDGMLRSLPCHDRGECPRGERLRSDLPPEPYRDVDLGGCPPGVDRSEPWAQQLAKFAVAGGANEHLVDAIPSAAILDAAAGTRFAAAGLGHPLRARID